MQGAIMLRLELNDEPLVISLSQIISQLRHPKRLYGVLGETMLQIHRERFDSQVDPDGHAWTPLSPITIALKQKKGFNLNILKQRGYLSEQLAFNYDDEKLEFGSPKIYSRIHQFGGKTGKNHKITIPARPWLGLSQDDKKFLEQKARKHLQQQLLRNAV